MTQTTLPVDQREKCVKLKTDGSRCTRWARAGADMCGQHAKLTKARTPTGLSPDVQDGIFAALKDGPTFEQACTIAGASRTTAYAWLAKAEEPGSSDEYRAFAAGVELARLHLERQTLEQLAAAAKKGDVRAQTFLLGRLNPERFGRPPGQIRMPVDAKPARGDTDDEQSDNVVPLRAVGDGDLDF
jgi:hypothetical protein